MYQRWYLKNKELKPCMMMDLLSFREKGGSESCSLGDAAQSSCGGGAVPAQLALLPGDRRAETAKAGQNPLR